MYAARNRCSAKFSTRPLLIPGVEEVEVGAKVVSVVRRRRLEFPQHVGLPENRIPLNPVVYHHFP